MGHWPKETHRPEAPREPAKPQNAAELAARACRTSPANVPALRREKGKIRILPSTPSRAEGAKMGPWSKETTEAPHDHRRHPPDAEPTERTPACRGWPGRLRRLNRPENPKMGSGPALLVNLKRKWGIGGSPRRSTPNQPQPPTHGSLAGLARMARTNEAVKAARKPKNGIGTRTPGEP